MLVFDGSNYSHVSDAAPFHGGGGTTLAVICQRLGKEIHDVGTLTTSTTTTSAAFTTGDVTRFPDDYFNQHFFHNTTRSAWTQVTDWVQSTKIATVPAITSQVSGDSVELTARFTPDEYRDAINWAIQFAYPFLSRTIVSTALADGYEHLPVRCSPRHQERVIAGDRVVHVFEQHRSGHARASVAGRALQDYPRRLAPED